MTSRKKRKSTPSLTEALWLQKLQFIENEVIYILDVFNFLDEIIHLCGEDEAALAAFNTTPLFWNTVKYSMQESMFMGLGRLCDQSGDNVRNVLEQTKEHVEFFSKEALRRRVMERNLCEAWTDSLIARAWIPNNSADFSDLEAEVSIYLSKIEHIYKPIRNKYYGHRILQCNVCALFEKTNRKELGEALNMLYELTEALMSLYLNGTKPKIGNCNLRQRNDKIKDDLRSVVNKITGRSL